MKNITKAEFCKLKNIHSLHLIYLFPLLLAIIALITFVLDFNEGAIPRDTNPNFVLFRRFYLTFYSLFSPIILMLVYYAILQIEFKNKAWENLYILTSSKQKIYQSKMIVGLGITTLYVLASSIFILIVHFIIRIFFQDNFEFEKYHFYRELSIYPKYLITYWMLCLIIFNFFFYIENAILSVGCMAFLLLFSAFTIKPSWTVYWPLSYPFKVEGTYILPKTVSKTFLLYSAVLIPIIYLTRLWIFTRFFKPEK